MQSYIGLIAGATVVLGALVPQISFAQSPNQPVTRAEVRQDLIQLEHSGYKPSKTFYPVDIQAAEARVADGQANMSIGGAATGASQSGRRWYSRPNDGLYHHQ